jgi:hypothetical protein
MAGAKKLVALVLGGGVSVGAYIAGALDELISAFNQTDEFEIDIITGGFTGATTGALVAHGLLYLGGGARLHETRVDAMDIFRIGCAAEVVAGRQDRLGRGPSASLVKRRAGVTKGPMISMEDRPNAGKGIVESSPVRFRHADHLVPDQDEPGRREEGATEAGPFAKMSGQHRPDLGLGP